MRITSVLSTIVAITITLTLATSNANAEPKFLFEALDLVVGGSRCPTAKFAAIAARARAAGDTGQAAEMWVSVASCSGENGNKSAGARALTKAITLGFDDCHFLRTDAGIKALPNHSSAMRQVKTSPADMQELAWASAEVPAINHDTKMMIMGNMNRKDRGYTQRYPTTIPVRKTTNRGVMIYRWIIAYLTKHQRNMVRKSDMSRLSHLGTMGIINNMGTSSSSIYASRGAALRSMRFARLAAQQLQRRVMGRKFRAKHLSTTPRACSMY